MFPLDLDGIVVILPFIMVYMSLVIKLDEFIDRQIELQSYSEQITNQIKELIKEFE